MDALIGMTGFVGGHLKGQHDFRAQFNSRNISQSSGMRFGTVVCAAAPGSMLTANKFPERDKDTIDELIDRLSEFSAERFVLISTIAVLSAFDAGSDEFTTTFQNELAYGRNRRHLERFVSQQFENSLIIRLPALFGSGLKKNFLFDLLNPCPTMLTQELFDKILRTVSGKVRAAVEQVYSWNSSHGMFELDRKYFMALDIRPAIEAEFRDCGVSALNFHHCDSTFQFYELDRLWCDISKGIRAGIDVLHFSPEPLRVGDIFKALTGSEMPHTSARIHREDMHTRYAELWGETGHYISQKERVLGRIREFYVREKAAR